MKPTLIKEEFKANVKKLDEAIRLEGRSFTQASTSTRRK